MRLRLAAVFVASLTACRASSPNTRIDDALRAAKASAKPTMLILSADWCAACRLLDRNTLEDPRVVERLTRFVTLKVDLSSNDDEAIQLGRRFYGQQLPTLAFVASTGELLEHPHLVGLVSADELMIALDEVR